MFQLLTKKNIIYFSYSTYYSEPVTKDEHLEIEPPFIAKPVNFSDITDEKETISQMKDEMQKKKKETSN